VSTINAKKCVNCGPLGGTEAGGLEVGDVDGGPLGVLTAGQAAAITEVEDISGGPLGGAGGRSGSGHHRCWRRRWWAPWGVLLADPAAATTDVGDVNGSPLGVPPPGPAVAITKVEDIDGRPPGGAGGISSSGHHRS
jgi:hypothetical protein